MELFPTLNMIWIAVGGWTLLAVLLYSFYGPMQQSFVDECRQVIFEARDKIFLVAHQSDLDSGIHDNIRDELNLLIRYAHKITWTRMLLAFLLRKQRVGRRRSIVDWVESIEENNVREAVSVHVRSAMVALFYLIIKRSLIFIFLYVANCAVKFASSAISTKEKDVLSASTDIVHDAYEVELSSAKAASLAC